MAAHFTLNGDGPVAAEDLAEIRRLARHWNNRAEEFFDGRSRAEKARKCLWNGQSEDGRVWDDLNKSDPGLFDGASDIRFRHADKVVLDMQALLIGALKMADVQVSACGGRDAKNRAAAALCLGRWLAAQAGVEWGRAWRQLTQWYLADDPAIALMEMRWRSGTRLEMRSFTPQEAGTAWLAEAARQAGQDQYALAAAQDAVARGMAALGEGAEGAERKYLKPAADALARALGAEPGEAAAALRRALAEGSAEVPVGVPEEGRVSFSARRFGSEFVFPDNVKEFEEAPCWFVPEWITVEELKARGWDPDFVREVEENGDASVLTDSWEAARQNTVDREGIVQVVWAYVAAVDRHGRAGKYVCVFSHGDKTAFGWRLLRGRGKWPGVLFQRETPEYATDSRGVAGLASPSQGMMRALWNGAGDNAILGLTPPVILKGRGARNQNISPLKTIGLGMNEDIGFMNPPAFPAAGMRVAEKLEEEDFDYFGLPRKDGAPEAASNRQRADVDWFLQQAAEVWRRMIELAQENMGDEELAEVTDQAGNPAGVTRELLSGRFSVALKLEADDLDSAKLVEKLKTVGTIVLGMDRARAIDTSPLVDAAVCRLFPDIGPKTVQASGRGQQDELDDEARNLASIRSGVMPRMDTSGHWDYQARLDMYRQMQAQNPAVFEDMGEDKRQMLGKWIAAMQQQATQYGANRQIGRTGVPGVEG